MRVTRSTHLKCSEYIPVPLTICIDQTRRTLAIDFPCYGALEIVSVIIIIIIIIIITKFSKWGRRPAGDLACVGGCAGGCAGATFTDAAMTVLTVDVWPAAVTTTGGKLAATGPTGAAVIPADDVDGKPFAGVDDTGALSTTDDAAAGPET